MEDFIGEGGGGKAVLLVPEPFCYFYRREQESFVVVAKIQHLLFRIIFLWQGGLLSVTLLAHLVETFAKVAFALAVLLRLIAVFTENTGDKLLIQGIFPPWRKRMQQPRHVTAENQATKPCMPRILHGGNIKADVPKSKEQVVRLQP